DFIHQLLESFGRELCGSGGFVFQNLDRESSQDGVGVGPAEHLGVVGSGQGRAWIVFEDQRRTFGQLLQAIDRWCQQLRDPLEPDLYLQIKRNDWKALRT